MGLLLEASKGFWGVLGGVLGGFWGFAVEGFGVFKGYKSAGRFGIRGQYAFYDGSGGLL